MASYLTEQDEEKRSPLASSSTSSKLRSSLTPNLAFSLTSADRIAMICKKLDQDDNGGIDLFELHTALISTNTIVPIDNVIHIFNVADKNSDGSLSLKEFKDCLLGYGKLQQSSAFKKHVAILKTLLTDFSFWLLSLYFWAGILLIIPAFSPDLPSITSKNMHLAVTLMYMACSSHYIFRYPFLKWRSQISIEHEIRVFKKTLFTAAKEQLENNGEDTERMDNATILKHIGDKIIFQSDKDSAAKFLKCDLEVLVLFELGHCISGALIDDIWASIDVDYDGTIDPDEFYSFLTTDVEPPTKTRRACSILWEMVTDKTWLSCLMFLLAGCVSFFVNVLPRHGHEIRFSRNLSPSTLIAWLFIMGTLYFSFASFDSILASYNWQQTAKEVIAEWIATMDECEDRSARNMSTDTLMEKCHSNGGLSKNQLHRLLENSSIYLPKAEFEMIFDEIDESNDGKVCKNEIEEYVNRAAKSKKLTVLIRCLKSFDFWAHTTWFYGSINYVIASYGVWTTWNYRLGAVFYFLGGLNLVFHSYQMAVTNQEYAFNIYSALKSGTKDDVRFDAWTEIAHSSLSLTTDLTRRGISSTSGDIEEVFLDEI